MVRQRGGVVVEAATSNVTQQARMFDIHGGEVVVVAGTEEIRECAGSVAVNSGNRWWRAAGEWLCALQNVPRPPNVAKRRPPAEFKRTAPRLPIMQSPCLPRPSSRAQLFHTQSVASRGTRGRRQRSTAMLHVEGWNTAAARERRENAHATILNAALHIIEYYFSDTSVARRYELDIWFFHLLARAGGW